MKHAILLLAHKGTYYTNNFVEQFENNQDIDIFIHIDRKCQSVSQNDLTKLLSRNKSIKRIISTQYCEYLTFSIVKATLDLINAAKEYNEYDYFHLMSEQCYLICPVTYFLDFFNKYRNYSFIEYSNCVGLMHDRIYTSIPNHTFVGSQWWSLKNREIDLLLEEHEKYKDKYDTLVNVAPLCGAFDETYIQNLLLGRLLMNNIATDRIINNSLRHISWNTHIRKSMHPEVITENNIPYIYNGKIIARKIDVNNASSKAALNTLKKDFIIRNET